MTRHRVARSLLLAVALSLWSQRVDAQGPTIDTGAPAGPGSNASTLGSSPGANDSTLGSSPGTGGGAAGGQQGAVLGGRAGPSVPRIPSAIAQQPFGIPAQGGIAAPQPTPNPEVQLYGAPLSEPLRPEYEGPPDGLTLDMAIERMVKQNLDLLAKYYEIPMAQADILTASLRSNPVFYADTQLVPYGQYSNARPGGPTQFDINISYPLDVSHKRRARTVSAGRAKRVLEAQYQDAIRLQIDNLYNSYVDVLAARLTVRYAEKALEGLNLLYAQMDARLKAGENIQADLNAIGNNREAAAIGVEDARASLLKKKFALGTMLQYPPNESEAIEVLGTIQDKAPPAPPLEELIRIALESRPDLTAYRLGLQRAQSDVQLQKANRLQDLYLLYQPYTFQNNQAFGTKSATSWALGITVPLPVFNRNQGLIQRARLNVTQTQIQLQQLERQVINDLQVTEKEYTASRDALNGILNKILPAARQVKDNKYTQYRGGEVTLSDFLEAQKDYNDKVKLYVDSAVRHRNSMLDLNTAVGQRILP